MTFCWMSNKKFINKISYFFLCFQIFLYTYSVLNLCKCFINKKKYVFWSECEVVTLWIWSQCQFWIVWWLTWKLSLQLSVSVLAADWNICIVYSRVYNLVYWTWMYTGFWKVTMQVTIELTKIIKNLCKIFLLMSQGKKKLGVNFFFYRTRIICETIVIQDNICYKRNTLVCL